MRRSSSVSSKTMNTLQLIFGVLSWFQISFGDICIIYTLTDAVAFVDSCGMLHSVERH